MRNLISDYLKHAFIMQLSTSVNNQSWTCTVYFAYDENLNLYWISRPDRRHSQEITQNPKVSGAIVKLHTYGEKVRGVQYQGTAQKLENEEEVFAIETYTNRYNTARPRVTPQEESRSIYRVKPELFVLFDEVNFPENPRQELRIG